VSDARSPIPPPRARPVAELPLDALLARADELARRWAVALILARPLEGIGGVPLEELARGAPALCAQTIRALHSDLELDRLTGSGAPSGREHSAPARSLAEMSGALDAPTLVLAVEALRGALWEGLLQEIRLPAYGEAGSRQLADLGDRLAHVCARMLVAALEAGAGVAPAREPDGQAPPAAGGESPARHAGEGGRAVLVDERIDSARAGASPPDRAAERMLAREHPQEIEIHDARGGEGPAAWIGSISRQLERLHEDGLPFAVLLVEAIDVEPVALAGLAGPSGEMLRLTEEIEGALAVALGVAPGGEPAGPPPGRGRAPWSGSLTRERPGRYWLLAPETDRVGAERLAERLRRAVASVVEYRGMPLDVVIGTAVCPEDGMQAAALASHADIGLYAARSARARMRRRTAIDETA
jgi:hypothetical protein